MTSSRPQLRIARGDAAGRADAAASPDAARTGAHAREPHANREAAPALRGGASGEPALPARAEAELQWGTSDDIPLDALYARYAPYVAAIAMRILGRESEVEDLVQDVFATAVRGLRRRSNHAEIKRWLATVAVRRSIRRLRLLALWSWMDLDEEPQWERIADPDVAPDERRLIAHVYRALDRLPIRDRVAWVLRHVEGESLQQVAELCGCSLATVKRRIARAQSRISASIAGIAIGIEGRARRGS
jgi:RNA polymerase sigma-70 factor (ECF subfamily)